MRSFEIQAQCFLVDIHIIIFTAMDRFQILKGPQNNHLTINFGSYGQVKLGRDLQTGKIVAIKMIYKLAESQMLLHPKLSHPNIISLIDIHFDISKQTTYLILEYSEEGPLSDKIKIGKLKKAEIKKYFKEVCQALAYLHQKKIMHRDVKPQNILITNTNQTKLNDFGVATFASAPKTVCSSYEYMAPEMILNKPYDHKVDVWALGILLFEMIGGNAPFRGNQPEIVLKQMKTKIYFGDNFDKQDISLIKYLLRVNPKNRPEVAELLKHSYFTSEEKIQNISSTTTTQQVSCRGNSHQLFSEILNSKPIVELPNRIEMMSKKQIYSDIYLSQQTKPKKGQRTQSCFDQNLKSEEKIKYRIPSFIPRTQKIIEPLQIDFFAKIEQKTQPQSPTSPLTFRKKNSKATIYN